MEPSIHQKLLNELEKLRGERIRTFNLDEISGTEISDQSSLTDYPLVSVTMITYNHEPYIDQAIEGVLFQETDFSIELVIGEDCSTDRTREIVMKYQKKHPEIIRVIMYDQNVGARKNSQRTLKACRGKYIAFCEGDDYWTDPLKLQKQVDFLEKNPNHGMVYTNYQTLFEDSGKIVHRNRDPKIPDDDIYYKYLTSSFIGTLTVMARSDLIKEYVIKFKELMKAWVMGDRPLWLYISSRSKCGFLDDYTAVYRRNANSVSSFQDVYKEIEFLKSSYDIRYFFIEQERNIPEEIREKVDNTLNRDLLSLYFKAKDKLNGKLIFRRIRNPRITDYMRYIGTRNLLFRFVVNSILGA